MSSKLHTGHYLGNFAGDVPDIGFRRPSAAMDAAQLAPRSTGAAARPALTAYPGYDGHGQRFFYLRGGQWLDTLDDAPWAEFDALLADTRAKLETLDATLARCAEPLS